MSLKENTISRSKLCLSRLWCIHYAGMIHLCEYVKLAELETLQVSLTFGEIKFGHKNTPKP